jgi:hypothetical protein
VPVENDRPGFIRSIGIFTVPQPFAMEADVVRGQAIV